MEFKIRKTNRKDTKEIARIFKEEFNKKPYNEKWSSYSALKKIKEYLKYNEIYIATVSDQAIGFIIAYIEFWFEGYQGLIERFAVSKEFQRKGVGKALLKKIEMKFKKRRVSEMYLWAFKNSGAYKFYPSNRYKEKKEMAIFKKKLK